MKKGRKKIIILALLIMILTTGCAQTLVDKKKQAVKNEVTGQNLTANILCKPKDKETYNVYKKNKVDVDKLPDCDKFTPASGKYESLWTSIFIKPLAYILLLVGKVLNSYALSIIIISLAIRLIAYPVTKKTAMQSEIIKKAQPEINRIQKKYEGKTDQDSMLRQNQELMSIYKKYNINPLSGCLFSMLQLPLFIAFFEAVQRTPALFEDKFLGLQLGTTPMVGISSTNWYMYVILMLIISFTTYYSFKMNMSGTSGGLNSNTMPIMMSVMIIITAIFMPSALGIYWVTTNVFTIIQNILVKRSKEVNGKA